MKVAFARASWPGAGTDVQLPGGSPGIWRQMVDGPTAIRSPSGRGVPNTMAYSQMSLWSPQRTASAKDVHSPLFARSERLCR